MKKVLIWLVLIVVAIGLAAGGVAIYMIGPRNIIGMMRYDQRREGALAVGDAAPDVILVALDGTTKVRLAEQIGQRPLVLVFGSYT